MRRNLLIWLAILFTTFTTPIISSASVVQDLTNPNALPPGTQTDTTYTVKPGDTLWSVAKQLGLPERALQDENHITNPRLLQVGEVLQYKTWRLPLSSSKSSTPPISTWKQPVVRLVSRGSDPLSGQQNPPYTRVLSCTLTAYSAGPGSTGKRPGDKGYGITATGRRAQQGVTVAVDPNVIAYGTKLYIPGVGYRIAEDTGGAIVGDHIDIYYNHRSTALQFGVRHHQKVYILPNWFHFPLAPA